MPAAGHVTSCTLTRHEGRLGHKRPGLRRRRERSGHARQGYGVIQRLPLGAVVLPVQTLGELFNVLVRKAKRRPARARAAVLSWRDAYHMVETSAAGMVNATDLASDHGLTIWDSVVLAASAEAECRLLLS